MRTGMSRIFDNGPNRPWAGHHRISGAGIRLHNPVAWGRQKSGALGHRAIGSGPHSLNTTCSGKNQLQLLSQP